MTNSPSLDALIAAAQEWATRGIPVFPVKENKSPLTTNGFHDAVTSPKEVKTLFEFYGDAVWGIGGRMGDGIFAVDIDLYKSNEVKTWFNARIEDGSLPETRTHKTKNDGLHLIYEGKAPDCKPVNGVEIKSDGGYIVLPGSPGYEVLKDGVAKAPDKLLELIRYRAVSSRGSSIAQLEAQIMSGADFHSSLTQLAAKLAAKDMSQVDIQDYLIRVLKSSTAANAGHDRHSRWRTIMADQGGELSRIATSAYTKFNDDAANDEFGEVAMDLGPGASFFDAPEPVGDVPIPKVNSDVWPFEGEGYFPHQVPDLSDVKFHMHPIYTEGETVVVFAEPKTGKTAVCLTTALHLACGLDLGVLKVREAGPVLYFALEGTHAIRLRIASWVKTMKERGVALPDVIPMHAIERSTNFAKDDQRKITIAKIIAADDYSKKFGTPLKAIFIDTLTKAMSGKDQNSVEDTSYLFETVSLLREAGVTATIVFVHHKARQGNVRGSSNIEAEPDMLLDITKKGSVIKMRVARARSIEDGGVFHFGISNVDLGKTKQGYNLSGMFVEQMDGSDVDDADAYGQTHTLAQRRKVVVSIAKDGFTAADAAVKEWFALGLIEGQKFRSQPVPPSLKLAHVKEALTKLADDAGGSIYGDSIIRPVFQQGEVVGYSILSAK